MLSLLNEVFAKHKYSPGLWDSPLMRKNTLSHTQAIDYRHLLRPFAIN